MLSDRAAADRAPSRLRRSSPFPRDVPNPVLLFDGTCRFWTWLARWVQRRARGTVLALPWQRADLEACGVAPKVAGTALVWVDHAGAHPGHRAVGRAFMACGGAWPVLGRLVRAGWLAPVGAAAYSLVADVQGHLPGIPAALEDEEAWRTESARVRDGRHRTKRAPVAASRHWASR